MVAARKRRGSRSSGGASAGIESRDDARSDSGGEAACQRVARTASPLAAEELDRFGTKPSTVHHHPLLVFFLIEPRRHFQAWRAGESSRSLPRRCRSQLVERNNR